MVIPEIEFKAIKEAAETAVAEMKTLVDRQTEEIKEFGATTKETAEALDKTEKSLNQIQDDFKGMIERLDGVEAKQNRRMNGGEGKKSAGQIFVESPEFKEFVERGARGNSGAVVLKDIAGGISGNTADAGGALLTPFLRDAILRPANQPLFVADLLQDIPVNTDAVQIFREKEFINNAGPQFDTSDTTRQFARKNQSEIQFESDTVPVETIAHWIPVSRQILSDVPRMRAYVDQRLWYGLQVEKDSEILYGTGQDGELRGFFEDGDIQSIGGYGGTSANTSPATEMIDHFRHGITRLQRANYYNVNGAVISPEDWETIETAKGSDGHYVWVNVNDGGVTRLWRVPIVVSNSIEGHDFLMGDFAMAAALYVREGYSARLSEHHEDFFVRNAVALLGEERLALGIELPRAFVKGTFDASATS